MVILSDNDTIPITGMTQFVQIPLAILIGLIGSIVAVVLFPRIFCKLLLKSKKKVMKRWKNGYIQTTPTIFSKYKLIKRFLFIVLLELGFLAFVLPLIDPVLWLPGGSESVKYYEDLGVPPAYVMTIIFTFVPLLLPLVVGLWSIGWAFEDSGLMHYKFDSRPGRELYEIEPVHVRFNSFLKGYSGISSVLFLILAVIAWAGVTEEVRFSDIIGTILIPIFVIISSIPAYVVYAFLTGKKDFLRKNLQELKILKEEEIFKNQ